VTDPNRIPLYSRADGVRRSDRDVHEMLGMVRGIVCDGVVTEGEFRAFQGWIATHPDLTVSWPGNRLAERIVRIASDGVISVDERHDLYQLFCDTVGEGDISEDEPGHLSTRLPIDDPQPTIVFPGNIFCFTGMFVYGSRSQCEHSTILRGGICHPNVIKKPMTLVIGGHGNDAWLNSTFGLKIEQAMHRKEQGVPIAIVSEEHWTDAGMHAPVVAQAQ
jgi:hypothetical protein